jgi:hypothetical protein
MKTSKTIKDTLLAPAIPRRPCQAILDDYKSRVDEVDLAVAFVKAL